MTTRQIAKLSKTSLLEIRRLLSEARRFGTALSNWRCPHMAALLAAMKAGLSDLVDDIKIACGITLKVIGEWAAKKRVQMLRDQYFVAA